MDDLAVAGFIPLRGRPSDIGIMNRASARERPPSDYGVRVAEGGLMRFYTRAFDDGGVDAATQDRIDAAFREHARELGRSLPSGLQLLVEGGGDIWLHDAQPFVLQQEANVGAVVLRMHALDFARGAEESFELTINYRDAKLVGIERGDIEDVVLSPKAQVFRSELDSLNGEPVRPPLLTLGT